ncbi:MAG: penicillin-binding transpeptidase domain-containing protein [Chloroflexota bacterium]|nr:penicillin-binding transpeptidase domain-containing protein [Chloroflexota bacterium]
MARRKRMVYDPPHLRKGRKGRRPGPLPRPDQIFMTRRMFLAKGAVVAAFGALATRLGYLQVVEGEKFQVAAIENIRTKEVLKPTRGLILDRQGRELAINERTWEVRLLPAGLRELGEAERARVIDQLINALGLPDALVLNPRSIPIGEEETIHARTAQILGKVLEVEATEEATQLPVLGTPGWVVRVNGQPLRVFVYADEAARRGDSTKISADGSRILGQEVQAEDRTPRFYAKGNVLAFIATEDDLLASRVQRAIDGLAPTSTLEQVVAGLRQSGLKAWRDYIASQEEQNYLVILDDDLTTDLAARCRAQLNELPGVQVINRLEYMVANGTYAPKIVVKSRVPREVALKLEANKLSLPGIELDGDVLRRVYRGGEAMSHVLGYVGGVNQEEIDSDDNKDETGNALYEADDQIGKDGLETTMEALLRGNKGSRLVEMSPAGGPGTLVPRTEIPPTAGRNIALTIDLELQRAVSEILRAGIAFSNADRKLVAERDPKRPFGRESGAGAVVVLDPRNGEVLAMVSVPHFDNQLFVDGISTRKYDEYASDAANKPLVDRALRGEYPPGSTLKPFLAAAALHERKIDDKKTYRCRGAIRVPTENDASDPNDHPCWNREGHGEMDVFGAIEKSCDVFFYNVGAPRQKYSETRDSDYLHYRDLLPDGNVDAEKHYFEGLGIDLIGENLSDQFWFGSTTRIDLPSEAKGVVPNDPYKRKVQGSGWSVGDTINTSIGQGFFASTPLQLALNTAALANHGTILKPRLIRETFDDGRRRVDRPKDEVLRKLGFSRQTLDVVREGMRRVVQAQREADKEKETGRRWALTNPDREPEIVVAGKTGTAEIGTPDENGVYDRQHALFTAFAPLDEPEVALSVIVEDGGEGSNYAVPIADRVMRAYLEWAGKRPRGMVLRAEPLADGAEGSVLAEGAAFPDAGVNAVPGAQPQD